MTTAEFERLLDAALTEDVLNYGMPAHLRCGFDDEDGFLGFVASRVAWLMADNAPEIAAALAAGKPLTELVAPLRDEAWRHTAVECYACAHATV